MSTLNVQNFKISEVEVVANRTERGERSLRNDMKDNHGNKRRIKIYNKENQLKERLKYILVFECIFDLKMKTFEESNSDMKDLLQK